MLQSNGSTLDYQNYKFGPLNILTQIEHILKYRNYKTFFLIGNTEGHNAIIQSKKPMYDFYYHFDYKNPIHNLLWQNIHEKTVLSAQPHTWLALTSDDTFLQGLNKEIILNTTDFIKLLNKFYASSFCNHIILLGNHDGQITTKKGSPLEEIEASGLAQIKWEPSFDEKNNILYLPYTLHKDKLDQFTTIPDNLRTYTHLDIAGTIKGIEMEIGKGINSLLPEYIIKKSNKIYLNPRSLAHPS
jgi:hypothetical protein